MRTPLLLLLPVILIGVISPAYAQVFTSDGNPVKNPTFFESLRFWFEDRWIDIQETVGNDRAKEAIAQNERNSITRELGQGIAVAQERIDRVRDRLGEQAVVTLVEANRINYLHEEYLRVKQIEDPDERLRQAEILQKEIDDNILVQQSCERRINVVDLLDDDDYYETLRTDYCSKTLKDISKEEASELLNSDRR